MADSPYVDESTNKKEKTNEVNTSGEASGVFKYAVIVLVILVIIMLLYYAVTCFSGNAAPPHKKTASKDVVLENPDPFSIEEEVDKLRIKQDEFKTRV
jgi:hypothetical protein